MKIRTKLTIFFTAIFFVLVLLLSIWYQYRLFNVLRQEVAKNLDMFSEGFFQHGPGGPDGFKKNNDINFLIMKIHERMSRDEFSRMISKRTWFALYDSDFKVVEQTPFAQYFPLKNIKSFADREYFTTKLKIDANYFRTNDTVLFRDFKMLMEQEFYTDENNHIFNCVGKISVLNLENGKYFLVVLIPDDKNVKYLQKTFLNVIFSLIILICIIVFLGFLYSKYSLNPINKIINELNAISEEDLSKRIKMGSNNKDEIFEISFSINNLLSRIENAFKMEKQFISDVSHEFKTPIAILQLNIDNISNNPHLTDDEIDKISSSMEILYSMNFLIQKLLYLSRLESNLCAFNQVKIPLKDLLETIVNNLQAIAEQKNLDFKLEIKDDDLFLNGDRELLYIALYNIVENALKYTETGFVKISSEKFSDRLVIKIEDSGIGIPENKIDKIFNKFYRIDSSRHDNRSFGIGLTIAKRIFDIHNSKIEIESVEKKGTKFVISFFY
jgi:signal transduction histidine kinase